MTINKVSYSFMTILQEQSQIRQECKSNKSLKHNFHLDWLLAKRWADCVFSFLKFRHIKLNLGCRSSAGGWSKSVCQLENTWRYTRLVHIQMYDDSSRD